MPSFFSSLEVIPSTVDGVTEISFDTKYNQIRELFLRAFGLSSNSSDADFKKFLHTCDLNNTIKIGHDVLKTSDFDSFFRNILDDFSNIFGPIAHQARPTFRIQKQGTRSVPFHTDDLSSGHPSGIINVWMPLVSLDKSNTLYFVPKDKTLSVKREFLERQSSIEWITEASCAHSRPWISDYGNVVLFSNQILHGTVHNDSYPRASIDFRILPHYSNAQMNKKSLFSDYIPYDPQKIFRKSFSAPSLKQATSVIYGNGDASHLSHQLQRQIINEFAHKNQFNIVRETAEWQTPHYPIINEILDTDPSMSILLTSEKCFKHDNSFTSEFKRIEDLLKLHASPVYFCLENYKIN